MKTRRILSFILVLISTLGILGGCSLSDSTVRFTVTGPKSGFDIHTDLQRSYLECGDFRLATEYATGAAELSIPLPVTLQWSVEAKDGIPKSYTVAISKNSDMSEAKTYKTKSQLINIYNLEIGTEYFWTVTANYEKKSHTCAVNTFSTADIAPRNLYVKGVTNFRDIGGRKSYLGGKIRQGLIFRCGALNAGSGGGTYDLITKEGKKTMLEELGVKTEIDLRMAHTFENTGTGKSALGDSVTYIALPMDYNLPTWLDTFSEDISSIFALMADENNYPLFIHCSIGTDRTGMMSFLINGLLGVEEDDLYFDYMLSNFGKIGGTRNIDAIWGYINYLADFEGETLAARIESYLLSIGVTQPQIDSFKAIMLEK